MTAILKAMSEGQTGGTAFMEEMCIRDRVYPEIDMVTTPTGRPVAMVHCNNCTSDINAWAEALYGFAKAAGLSLNKGDVYTCLLYTSRCV